MQTVTHLAIGAFIGAAAFRHQPLAQLACIAASVGPDVVMMPLFALDKLRGRQPLLNQGPGLLVFKELSHSLFLALLCLLAGMVTGSTIVIAFGVGWLAHIVIDVLTHGDPKFQALGDPHYIWPVGSLQGLAVWEYRIETGQLWPLKPLELWVLIVSSGLAIIAWNTP